MFERGKIVLVPFPFTDLSAQKVRPALIVSSTHAGKADVIVAFIGSSVPQKIAKSIVALPATKISGLKVPSCLYSDKIATLDRNIVLGEIGSVTRVQMKDIEVALCFSLGIVA